MTENTTFLNFGAGQQAALNRPQNMAELLLAACPQQAASFAIAAHERACCTHDDGRAEFWDSVASILTAARDGAEQKVDDTP